MKRILSILFLAAISFAVHGQTLSLTTRLNANIAHLATFRTYNNTSITTKTGAGSINPISVGGNIDSVCRYTDSCLVLLQQLYDSTVLAGGNLQAVTNAGNVTTNDVFIGDTAHNYSQIDSIFCAVQSRTLGTIAYIWNNGGYGELSLLGSTPGWYANFVTNYLTGVHTYIAPNEGDGSSIGSAIVLHKTKDNIKIGDTTGAHVEVNAAGTVVTGNISGSNAFTEVDNSGVINKQAGVSGQAAFYLSGTGGNGSLNLGENASGFNVSTKAIGLTANRQDTIGDKPGVYLMNNNTIPGSRTYNIATQKQIDSLAALLYAGLNPTTVKTTTYNASPADFVICNTTSGGFPVNLPVTPADRSQIGIKMTIQGSMNAVTINAGGSAVFNKSGGSTSLTLALLNQGAILQYNTAGNVWFVLSDDLPFAALTAYYDARYTASGSAWLIGGNALSADGVIGSTNAHGIVIETNGNSAIEIDARDLNTTIDNNLIVAGTTDLATVVSGTWNGDPIATPYIANDAITYGKLQDVLASQKLLGTSSTTTTVQPISLGANLSITGTTLNVVPGAGGVTSIATGYGLSGGTITGTGTILADTSTLENYIYSLRTFGFGIKQSGSRGVLFDSTTVNPIMAGTFAGGYAITYGGRTFVFDSATAFTKMFSTIGNGYGLSKGGRTLIVDTATLFSYLRTTLPTSSGTVTSVSVATANGFTGTVATATTTPAITLTTTVNALMAGNGTALMAATSVNVTTALGYTPLAAPTINAFSALWNNTSVNAVPSAGLLVTVSATPTSIVERDINGNVQYNNNLWGSQSVSVATTLNPTSQYETELINATATITLPIAANCSQNQPFLIHNSIMSNINILTSGGTIILIIYPGNSVLFRCTNTGGGTGTASWTYSIFAAAQISNSLTNQGVGIVSSSSGFKQIISTSAGTTSTFLIGSSPPAFGNVLITNNIGSGTTTGLELQNTTAAISGTQQNSPALLLEGQGFKSNSTAASQAVDARIYMVPQQGTAAPSGQLNFDIGINATFSTVMNLFSSGRLTLNGIAPGVLADGTFNQPTAPGFTTAVFSGGNNTAAISGVPVQFPLNYESYGTAWNTTSTSSNVINFNWGTTPVSGTSTSGKLVWNSSVNGGTVVNDIMDVDNTGKFTTANGYNTVGSSSLGPITTGTWTATPIDNAHLVNSSFTINGTPAVLGTSVNITTTGGLLSESILTSSGTFTPTSGTTSMEVTCSGGGGGGGYAISGLGNIGVGGGGAAGAMFITYITSVSGTYTYTIGAAGTGGIASSSTAATAGGNTTFVNGATTYTAGGGAPGVSDAGSAAIHSTLGSNPGTSTNANLINAPIMGGDAGIAMSITFGYGGNGGSGPWGCGGGKQFTNNTGNAGNGYGSGSGGAISINTVTSYNGGTSNLGGACLVKCYK